MTATICFDLLVISFKISNIPICFHSHTPDIVEVQALPKSPQTKQKWENSPEFIALLRRNIFTTDDLAGLTSRELALIDQGSLVFHVINFCPP
jgi:hypothetical protein